MGEFVASAAADKKDAHVGQGGQMDSLSLLAPRETSPCKGQAKIFLKDIFFVPGYPDFTRMDGWMLWSATRCQIVLQGAFLVCLLPTQFVFSSFCCCLK
jgi:hypothetical protein